MKVIDPVCKMELEEKEARFKSEYKGETYYFCASRIKRSSMKIRKNILSLKSGKIFGS